MSLYDTRLTGRGRTLRLAGTFSVDYNHIGSLGDLSSERYFYGKCVVDLGQYGIHIEAFTEVAGEDFAGGGRYVLKVTAPAPLSISSTQQVTIYTNPFDTNSHAGTVTGSFEIEIDVDEEQVVGGFTLPEIPWWDINDGVAIVYTLREVPRNTAGNVRIDASFGTLSYSHSFTRPGSDVISGYDVKLQCQGTARRALAPGFARIEMEETNLWVNRNSTRSVFGTYSGVGPDNGLTYAIHTDTSGGLELEMAGSTSYFDGFSGIKFSGKKTAEVRQFVPIKTRLDAKIRSFETDYPGTLNLTVSAVDSGSVGSHTVPVPPGGASVSYNYYGGHFTGAQGWAAYNTSDTISAYPYDGDFNPQTSFDVRIDAATLSANLDDVQDVRIQGCGKKFGQVQITHTDSAVLESFSTGSSGWTPTNANLSGVSSLIITATSAGARAIKTYSPTPRCEAWRYWDIRLRSNVGDNQIFRVRVNGKKTYVVQSVGAGTYTTVRIDTNFPRQVASGVPAQQDSRWPIISAGDLRPLNEARNWGVNYIETLEFLDIPEGEEVEIDSITAIRSAPVNFQFISASPRAKQQYYGGVSGTDRRRHTLAIIDGRNGLEVHDAQGAPTLGEVDIAAYAAEVNSIPGWSCSLTGFSGYFDSSLIAQFVAGGGGTWDADGFVSHTDHAALSNTITVPCQFKFDRMVFYPGVGDPWAGTGYDDAETVLPFRYVKFLRGLGHGLVSSSAGRPAVGKTVTIRRFPEGDNWGSGVTSSIGYFETGTPFALGHRTYDFISEGRTLGTAVIESRKRQRVTGRVSAPIGSKISYDVSSSLRHYRAYIDGDGHVITGYTSNDIDWQDRDSGIAATGCCLKVFRRLKKQILYLLTEEDEDLILYTSEDEGETWNMAFTLATGKLPAFEIGLNGRKYFYWIEGTDSFDVKGRIYDAADQLLEDTFTAVEGVDEDGLAVRESVKRGGKHRIVLQVVVGGVITCVESENGVEFA